MYAIDGNMDPINIHQYTPFMLAYIPAPWILWVIYIQIDEPFPNPSKKHDQPIGPVAAKLCPSPCRWGHCRISEPLGVVWGKVGLLQLEITYKWSWVVVWNIWIIVHFIYGIYNPSHWLTDIFQDGEIAPPTRYKWRFFDRNILDFPLPCQTGALVLGLFTTNSIQQPLILSNSWRHKTLASGWIHVFLVKEWQCPFLPFFRCHLNPAFGGHPKSGSNWSMFIGWNHELAHRCCRDMFGRDRQRWFAKPSISKVSPGSITPSLGDVFASWGDARGPVIVRGSSYGRGSILHGETLDG